MKNHVNEKEKIYDFQEDEIGYLNKEFEKLSLKNMEIKVELSKLRKENQLLKGQLQKSQ
jgi:hypothetical protein